MKFIASKGLAIVSALAIALVAIVAYLPALRIGFLDGWWYLEWAAKLSFPQYLIQFFDPRNVTQGYRPVQGLYILAQYYLFQFNPDGYHLAHILFHAANCILLFAIVWRLGKNWRVALIASLLYAASPVYSLAVFWHAVVDPLAAFFYLLTILLWTRYLETGRAWYWAATFGAYIFALLSKEVAFFLSLILFLIERWFFNRRPSSALVIRQYAPFVVALIPYVLLELNVQSHGEFVGQFGFRIGPHLITNLMPYLAVLTFPWTMDFPSDVLYYVWLASAALMYLGITILKRSTTLLFLAMVAILNISPLLGFPIIYFGTRYLYFSMMVSAILLALLFENGWQVLGKRKWYAPAAYAAVTLLIIGNGMGVADAAAGLAEYTRQLRVPFSDIARQHPSFPDDTHLYFVYSPRTPLVDLQGLFMVRYGTKLTVSGTEDYRPAGLRDHRMTWVYYFDETARPREIVIDRDSVPRASVTLPADFEVPIRLEGFELANTAIKRGEPLILLLYWRGLGHIDKDYTVFVHLLDAKGEIVASNDSQPRRGTAPTSQWKTNQFVLDAVVLPITPEIAAGQDYRLEVGWYHQPTVQRLSIVDARGQPTADRIVIGPIAIQ